MKVKCPECEVESIGDNLSQFTLNLALMQLAEKRKQATTPTSLLDLSIIKSDYSSSSNTLPQPQLKIDLRPTQPLTSKLPSCPKHGKPLEAFCWSDCTALCLDCLLSPEHKPHDIHSLQMSLDLTRQRLADTASHIGLYKQQLSQQQSQAG